MTTITDSVPKESFRLSQLIYDTRYRSMTIQVVALIGFLIFVGWLINNTAQNLASLGKGLAFGFLFDPARYDINQSLIEYNSQSTHLRAAFVGVLNTLLIAVMGCVLATVIGLFVGILRLSKNWVVSRIMAVYVEMFRNVPLLLWIVLIMAVLIGVLPTPADFRGDSPAATMKLFGSVAFTNRGIYLPDVLFSRSLGDIHLFGQSAFNFNVSLNLIAIACVLAAGIFVSNKIKVWADRTQQSTGARPTTWYLRLAVVALPLIVTLLLLGFQLNYPEIKGFNFTGGIFIRNSFIALWLALSLYTAAFIAEIVRAGILAINYGQTEAAAALGLRPRQIMVLVILPQALRVIIPPLISNYLNLTKNSSLAIAVGYMDITATLMGITLNQTGRELETIMLGMLIYLTLSLSISMVMNWYNERVKLVER